MDTKSLIERISERTGRTAADVESLLKSFGELITEEVGQGDIISLPGFGTFEPKMREERVAVHPSTGKRILVPPKLSMIFKPSALLRQKVRNSDGQDDAMPDE